MSFTPTDLTIDPNWTFGVITSRFNEEITSQLQNGAIETLKQYGVKDARLKIVNVPGAIEIPVVAKTLLANGCDGVLALGAVIRGETTHYEYVCNSVERGCSMLAIETGKPVICGVLTTENEEQAYARIGGEHGHKGVEGAKALIEMLNLLTNLNRR